MESTEQYLEIKQRLELLLKPKRYRHSLGVVKEAVKLCSLYGGDPSKIKLAALLHDCAKQFDNERLLSYAKERSYPLDSIQQRSPELLHGPIGALYAAEEFHINDQDILNAIAYHTTGRAQMSLIEKIIYLADLTEEGRDFEELARIREISHSNLNHAVIEACNCSIHFVLKKNQLLHPLTIELRNDLIIGG